MIAGCLHGGPLSDWYGETLAAVCSKCGALVHRPTVERLAAERATTVRKTVPCHCVASDGSAWSRCERCGGFGTVRASAPSSGEAAPPETARRVPQDGDVWEGPQKGSRWPVEFTVTNVDRDDDHVDVRYAGCLGMWRRGDFADGTLTFVRPAQAPRQAPDPNWDGFCANPEHGEMCDRAGLDEGAECRPAPESPGGERCPECKGDGFFDALEGGNEHTTRDCKACGGSGMASSAPLAREAAPPKSLPRDHYILEGLQEIAEAEEAQRREAARQTPGLASGAPAEAHTTAGRSGEKSASREGAAAGVAETHRVGTASREAIYPAESAAVPTPPPRTEVRSTPIPSELGSAAPDAGPLRVACETCGAAKGASCVAIHAEGVGGRNVDPHPARVRWARMTASAAPDPTPPVSGDVLAVNCPRCVGDNPPLEGLGSVGAPCCDVGAGRVQMVCVERATAVLSASEAAAAERLREVERELTEEKQRTAMLAQTEILIVGALETAQKERDEARSRLSKVEAERDRFKAEAKLKLNHHACQEGLGDLGRLIDAERTRADAAESRLSMVTALLREAAYDPHSSLPLGLLARMREALDPTANAESSEASR